MKDELEEIIRTFLSNSKIEWDGDFGKTTNEIGLDSLNVIELITEIECELDIEVNDDRLGDNNTLEELISKIVDDNTLSTKY